MTVEPLHHDKLYVAFALAVGATYLIVAAMAARHPDPALARMLLRLADWRAAHGS